MSRERGDERGAMVAVETALILPILLGMIGLLIVLTGGQIFRRRSPRMAEDL